MRHRPNLTEPMFLYIRSLRGKPRDSLERTETSTDPGGCSCADKTPGEVDPNTQWILQSSARLRRQQLALSSNATTPEFRGGKWPRNRRARRNRPPAKGQRAWSSAGQEAHSQPGRPFPCGEVPSSRSSSGPIARGSVVGWTAARRGEAGARLATAAAIDTAGRPGCDSFARDGTSWRRDDTR